VKKKKVAAKKSERSAAERRAILDKFMVGAVRKVNRFRAKGGLEPMTRAEVAKLRQALTNYARWRNKPTAIIAIVELLGMRF
jgi:hypothetical protein